MEQHEDHRKGEHENVEGKAAEMERRNDEEKSAAEKGEGVANGKKFCHQTIESIAGHKSQCHSQDRISRPRGNNLGQQNQGIEQRRLVGVQGQPSGDGWIPFNKAEVAKVAVKIDNSGKGVVESVLETDFGKRSEQNLVAMECQGEAEEKNQGFFRPGLWVEKETFQGRKKLRHFQYRSSLTCVPRGLKIGRQVGEEIVQTAADEADRGNDDQGDPSGDQAIFNGSGAAFIIPQGVIPQGVIPQSRDKM